jgi:hypothetical protein
VGRIDGVGWEGRLGLRDEIKVEIKDVIKRSNGATYTVDHMSVT